MIEKIQSWSVCLGLILYDTEINYNGAWLDSHLTSLFDVMEQIKRESFVSQAIIRVFEQIPRKSLKQIEFTPQIYVSRLHRFLTMIVSIIEAEYLDSRNVVPYPQLLSNCLTALQSLK